MIHEYLTFYDFPRDVARYLGIVHTSFASTQWKWRWSRAGGGGKTMGEHKFPNYENVFRLLFRLNLWRLIYFVPAESARK